MRFTFKRAAALSVLALLCLAAVVKPSSAQVVYNQPPNLNGFLNASQNDTTPGGFGNFATMYDNFTLASTTPITDVSWYGSYFNPPVQGPITAFTLAFWSNVNNAPGTALSTQRIAGNANEVFAGGIFSYSASLPTAFTASAGTTYWLSIVPDLAFPPQWGWLDGTGGDGQAVQDFQGVRNRVSSDMAFSLSSGQGVIPEPGTAALLATGLLPLAGVAIRRRTV